MQQVHTRMHTHTHTLQCECGLQKDLNLILGFNRISLTCLDSCCLQTVCCFSSAHSARLLNLSRSLSVGESSSAGAQQLSDLGQKAQNLGQEMEICNTETPSCNLYQYLLLVCIVQ